jgi:hypothetical protein
MSDRDTNTTPDPGTQEPSAAQADPDDVITSQHEGRDITPDADAGPGGHWTGETEPDAEYRENTPTRGKVGERDVPAPDAF